MRPEKNRSVFGSATWRNTIAFATIAAVAILAFWIWRDGVSWGAVLGALLIWVVAFGTVAALRWYASR